jgi:PAS domain S-box-containing protein
MPETRDVTGPVEALRKLRASEERLAVVFNAAPISIFVARIEDGKILAANPGATAMLGYTSDELVGHTAIELGIVTGAEDRERALRSVRNGGTSRIAANVRTKTGELRSVEAAAAPLEWAGERCYIGAVLDVTEQRLAEGALRESEQRFAMVTQSAPVAIIISKLADGTFLDVNPAFTRLLGFSRDEVIGRRSTEIGLSFSSESRQSIVDMVKQHGALRGVKLTLRTKSGATRDFELSIGMVELKGEPCLVTIADDITERIRPKPLWRRARRAPRRRSAIARGIFAHSRSIPMTSSFAIELPTRAASSTSARP